MRNGEMAELAEGARLEIVCAALNRTQGSNPWPSARRNTEKAGFLTRSAAFFVVPNGPLLDVRHRLDAHGRRLEQQGDRVSRNEVEGVG